MKLHVRVYKESPKTAQKAPGMGAPLAEGPVRFVGKVSLAATEASRQCEVSGSSPHELVKEMRSKLATLNPDMERRKIPEVNVDFCAKRRSGGSGKGPERKPLLGDEMVSFFAALETLIMHPAS